MGDDKRRDLRMAMRDALDSEPREFLRMLCEELELAGDNEVFEPADAGEVYDLVDQLGGLAEGMG
jgi:hypothetical protein